MKLEKYDRGVDRLGKIIREERPAKVFFTGGSAAQPKDDLEQRGHKFHAVVVSPHVQTGSYAEEILGDSDVKDGKKCMVAEDYSSTGKKVQILRQKLPSNVTIVTVIGINGDCSKHCTLLEEDELCEEVPLLEAMRRTRANGRK